jgi:DNA-binding transcriptional LysR family regulator
MLPNLKALGVFAKVAETGSFAQASKALNISAPVVSQHISQLEETLDTALVYRSTRSLTLTDAGQKLARYANDMLDAAESGLETLQSDVREYSGNLSITAPSFLASPGFSKELIAFSEKYPNVNLRISYSTEIVNLIDSGFDMAIRIGNLPDSNLRARKLMDGFAEIFASPDLIEKYGMPSTPQDLINGNYPWLIPPMWEELCLHRVGDLEDVVNIPLKGRFCLDNGEAEKQLALLGAGIGLLPKMYVEKELNEGSLVQLLPDWISPPVGVYAVWPQNAGSRSLTRLFIEHFLEFKMLKHGPSVLNHVPKAG